MYYGSVFIQPRNNLEWTKYGLTNGLSVKCTGTSGTRRSGDPASGQKTSRVQPDLAKVSRLTRGRSVSVDMGVLCSVFPMFQGGVIGIKIGWVCDLDRADDQCNPSYSFTRLDAMSQKNAVSPGYNFRSPLQNSSSQQRVYVSVCVV